VLAAVPENAAAQDLESLERNLIVLEDKLFGALRTAAPEDLLVKLDEHADRELAPYAAAWAQCNCAR